MPRRGAGRLHGYLIIDKPANWTSHDVVAKVRRLTGERKVGHAGTLDPAATGVLPVAVGLATRSLEFLASASKTYVAELTLGITTDSYDGDGTVVAMEAVPKLESGEIRAVLDEFVGPQEQLPPMFSAIRVDGKRLYELARRGVSVERAPRAIVIHELALINWTHPTMAICVDCSKGTYIRSLAHDIGERLGCGAYLSNLVRQRTGPFDLDDAWTLIELAERDLVSEWESISVHPDAGAHSLDAIILDDPTAVDWDHGRLIPNYSMSTEPVRVYDERGDWLGVGIDSGDGQWRPNKVISSAA